jgi:hypothetical protein
MGLRFNKNLYIKDKKQAPGLIINRTNIQKTPPFITKKNIDFLKSIGHSLKWKQKF